MMKRRYGLKLVAHSVVRCPLSVDREEVKK